ncbi:DUF4926 domain-containing protein [Longimicrobium sp.]|uniref:DUF4926 domain-containing protein n=1 Tax=Longimicrobium sp. TaxID=2029185 RepID=UPI0039C9DB89
MYAHTPRLREFDTVRVLALPPHLQDRVVWHISGRLPEVGDLGTIVDAHEEHRGPFYTVECTAGNGDTVWVATFSAEQLEFVQRPR